jgi:hypothetical protein
LEGGGLDRKELDDSIEGEPGEIEREGAEGERDRKDGSLWVRMRFAQLEMLETLQSRLRYELLHDVEVQRRHIGAPKLDAAEGRKGRFEGNKCLVELLRVAEGETDLLQFRTCFEHGDVPRERLREPAKLTRELAVRRFGRELRRPIGESFKVPHESSEGFVVGPEHIEKDESDCPAAYLSQERAGEKVTASDGEKRMTGEGEGAVCGFHCDISIRFRIDWRCERNRRTKERPSWQHFLDESADLVENVVGKGGEGDRIHLR